MGLFDDTKFRQRFVKDYNLPINIFSDDNIWAHYVRLYDFFPMVEYYRVIGLIEEEYDGNVEKWLEYCASVRDAAINGVMESSAYKFFNNMDMAPYTKLDVNIGEHSIYTEATDGKRFLSIDLRKANFQALRMMSVIEDKTYDDFILRYGGDEYIQGSKYLRQVIFGKMNPGRTIRIEKYYMNQIYKLVNNLLENKGMTLYSMNSDELVWASNGNTFDSQILQSFIKESLNLDTRCENVEIKMLPIVNARGNKVDAFVRRNIDTGEEVLKKASTTFYPQIYKLWKGIEIEDIDRVFFFEDQLAMFNEPLKLIENV